MWRWQLEWTLVHTVSPHKKRNVPHCIAFGQPVQSAGPWPRVLPSTWWNADAVVVAREIQKGFFQVCFLLWTRFTLYTLAHVPEKNHNVHQHSTIPGDRIDDLWGKQCRETKIERFWLAGKWCQRWKEEVKRAPRYLITCDLSCPFCPMCCLCHSHCLYKSLNLRCCNWMEIPINLSQR